MREAKNKERIEREADENGESLNESKTTIRCNFAIFLVLNTRVSHMENQNGLQLRTQTMS